MLLRLFMVIGAGLLAGGAYAQQSAAPAAPSSLVRQLNDAFADVYEKVAPAVVVIEVKRASDEPMRGLPQGLDFFLQGQDGSQQPYNSPPDQGSGFIIAPNGYILTNNHVVENAAEGGVTVRLKDGRRLPASLVGIDDRSDLAVIKVEADNLPTAELADSDAARVGQFAFAIGAPWELPYTFTTGVISAKGRNDLTPYNPNYEEYIQTDASINPGNSGGPLCDIDGKVIGINTLIAGMNRGLGFAVPSNIAREVSRQLIASGRVTRPWLGISIVGIDESSQARAYFPDVKQGVVVNGIDPDAPAGSSDLREGDVILKVDGIQVAYSRDLQREILKKGIGQDVKLDLWRGGKEVNIAVRTAEQPQRMMRASNNRRNKAPQQPPAMKKNVPASTPTGPGVTVEDIPANSAIKGVRVTEVAPDGAAAAAGLLPGDIITEAGGKPVTGKKDYDEVMKQMDPQRGVMLMVNRDGQQTFSILKF